MQGVDDGRAHARCHREGGEARVVVDDVKRLASLGSFVDRVKGPSDVI
jgi:hypothetical protein